jgi:hypothetical protein
MIENIGSALPLARACLAKQHAWQKRLWIENAGTEKTGLAFKTPWQQ